MLRDSRSRRKYVSLRLIQACCVIEAGTGFRHLPSQTGRISREDCCLDLTKAETRFNIAAESSESSNRPALETIGANCMLREQMLLRMLKCCAQSGWCQDNCKIELCITTADYLQCAGKDTSLGRCGSIKVTQYTGREGTLLVHTALMLSSTDMIRTLFDMPFLLR